MGKLSNTILMVASLVFPIATTIFPAEIHDWILSINLSSSYVFEKIYLLFRMLMLAVFVIAIVKLLFYLKDTKQISRLQKENEELKEAYLESSKYLLPYIRLVRDVVLKNETSNILAKNIFDAGLKLDDLKKIGFKDEIIKEFLKISHEFEIQKLNHP